MNALKERSREPDAVEDVSWTSVRETQPDEWDQAMLREISRNPECHMFLSSEEAMKELGL